LQYHFTAKQGKLILSNPKHFVTFFGGFRHVDITGCLPGN
jgi:hypothetical protein